MKGIKIVVLMSILVSGFYYLKILFIKLGEEEHPIKLGVSLKVSFEEKRIKDFQAQLKLEKGWSLKYYFLEPEKIPFALETHKIDLAILSRRSEGNGRSFSSERGGRLNLIFRKNFPEKLKSPFKREFKTHPE